MIDPAFWLLETLGDDAVTVGRYLTASTRLRICRGNAVVISATSMRAVVVALALVAAL